VQVPAVNRQHYQGAIWRHPRSPIVIDADLLAKCPLFLTSGANPATKVDSVY